MKLISIIVIAPIDLILRAFSHEEDKNIQDISYMLKKYTFKTTGYLSFGVQLEQTLV